MVHGYKTCCTIQPRQAAHCEDEWVGEPGGEGGFATHSAILCRLTDAGIKVGQELLVPDLELGHLLRARDDEVLQLNHSARASNLSAQVNANTKSYFILAYFN
jgi:hypothetical protein